MPNSESTVLITGANRGLGLGLAGTYLEDGWNVVTVSRTVSPQLEVLAGEQLQNLSCNLTDDAQLASLAEQLAGRRIDVLINNAGRMAKPANPIRSENVQGFGHFDRELWRDVFDINLFTPMHLAELLLQNLAQSGRGRIITISSMLGSMALNTSGGLYAYRATKAGVNAITRSMSIDLSGRGICCIALHPGWVRTDMGGSGADIDIPTSVSGMKDVIDGLTPQDSGKFFSWDGSEMPW